MVRGRVRKDSPTARTIPSTVAIILALGLAAVTACAGVAQDKGTTTTAVNDTNNVRLGDIEENYCKRFPFARHSREADQVNDGSSQSGGSLDVKDPAYKDVEVKCDYFSEEGSIGKEHQHYKQDEEQVSGQVASKRDTAVSKGWIKTYGLPISDTMFQIIDRENRQRFLELFFDPERWMWKETGLEQLKGISAANSTGAGAEATFHAAFQSIKETLINVADDRQALPNSGRESGKRSYSQAIYIVQQLYKTLFVPMAILLLLPGAVLTQVKGLVTRSFLGADEDATNPFTGIIRALIAIFLIPATQLIVSYSIDVGNTLAFEVRNPSSKWIQEDLLMKWSSEQMYTPPIANDRNALPTAGHEETTSEGGGSSASGGGDSGGNTKGQAGSGGADWGGGDNSSSTGSTPRVDPGIPGAGAINTVLTYVFGGQPQAPSGDAAGSAAGTGKSAGQSEGQVKSEDTLFLSSAMQLGFNTSAHVMGSTLTVLAAYQIVFMCYLFLLGPIAAALYAWPAGISKNLFNNVFSNWLNAVVVLALWRFWWCVILAVMTQRLVHLHPDPAAPGEMMVFNCFLALLLYIPFQPFNFQPGPIVASLLEKASAGGGTSGAPGGATAPGAGSPATGTPTASQSSPLGSGSSQGGAGSTAGGRDEAQSGSKSGEGHAGDRGGSDVSGDGQGGDGNRGASGDAPHGGRRAGESGGAVSVPPPVAQMSGVAGNSVNMTPPPLGAPTAGAGQSDVARALQTEFGGSPVSAIASGTAPTVALSPRGGPGILTNTTNHRLARAGYQALRAQAPRPGYLRDAGAASPGKPSGTDSTDQSQPPAQTSAMASPALVNLNVQVSGGSSAQQDSGRQGPAVGPPAPSSPPASPPTQQPPAPNMPRNS